METQGFQHEDRLAAEIRNRIKAAGEMVWQPTWLTLGSLKEQIMSKTMAVMRDGFWHGGRPYHEAVPFILALCAAWMLVVACTSTAAAVSSLPRSWK